MALHKTFGMMAVAALLALTTGPAQADTVIFMDDFDGENGGSAATQYTGFDNWDVVSGSVDLFGNGSFDFLPGNGLYVDMHGHRDTAGGKLQLADDLELGPGTYELKFDLAGAQRETDEDSLTVTFGDVVEIFSLPSDAPFSTLTMILDVDVLSSIGIMFQQSGSDGRGMLLDNVMVSEVEVEQLSAVPTPVAASAGVALLGLLAARRRRTA